MFHGKRLSRQIVLLSVGMFINPFKHEFCLNNMFRLILFISCTAIIFRLQIIGRDSSVGIATHYRLDGQGSNAGGGESFRIRPDRPWGTPSRLYNTYWVFTGDKEAGA